MEESGWQLDVNQLRRLMRNEVTNHDRIRSRILSLQERYYDGEMDDGGDSWERWAIAYFAYSRRHLRYLSSPHPLSLNKWEKQQQASQEKIAEDRRKEDAKRSQAAWDAMYEAQRYDAKRSQAAWDLYQQEQETAAARKLAKEKDKTAEAAQPRVVKADPDSAAVPYLAEIERLECNNRIAVGRQFAELRELANNNKLGKNDKGRYWKFNPWCKAFVERSYRDVNKCIEMYEKSRHEVPPAVFEGLRVVN